MGLFRRLVAIVILLPATALAEGLYATMDRQLDEWASRGTFSGIVHIVSKGQVIHKKVAGVSDHDRRIPLRGDEYFEIGSITKQMAAAGVLRLVEQGKLSLRDPLKKYFQVPKSHESITVLHLITHRSGLKSLAAFSEAEMNRLFARLGRLESNPKKLFETYLAMTPLAVTPGTAWEYNNIAYAMLAHLIDRVSGVSYEEYLRREFFRPHGIACGFQDGQSVPEGRETYGNYEGKNSYMRSGMVLAASTLRGSTSVVCTAEGLSAWAQALAARKIFDKSYDVYFFLKDQPAEYHTEQAPYSFGWFVHGSKLVSHTGANGGFEASLYLHLESGTSFVTLTNLSNTEEGALDLALANSF